jgi:coenzyme F420-reducing hydrogenase delta subunit
MKIMENRTGSKKVDFQPRIVTFACNWCSYAAADLAGVSRLQMPPNCRTIRVMCSARVRPEYVVYALSRGFDGVFILGCHPGECHYTKGNYYTRRRVLLLKEFLEFLGIEPERFQLRWVSASEGARYAQIMEELVERIKSLGPLSEPSPGEVKQKCHD